MSVLCYVAPYATVSEADFALRVFTEDGLGGMRGGDIRFCAEEKTAREADWLFVGDSAANAICTNVPRERRVLFLTEPPMIRKYPLIYLEKFGIIVSPTPQAGYSGTCVISNPCLGWSAGSGRWSSVPGPSRGLSLEEMKKFASPPKSKEISIVTSFKKRRQGHRERFVFFEALRSCFGDAVDYYGRDFNPVEDKLDAIAPYKYHIAIENCQLENYWTEKLSDAWIGWSLPIYCGDPAILRHVPDPMGIEVIDVRDIPGSLDRIKEILKEDPYPDRLAAIKKCRDWAIRASNRYEKLCELIENSDGATRSAERLSHLEKIYDPKFYRKRGIFRRISTVIIGESRTASVRKFMKNLEKGLRGRR